MQSSKDINYEDYYEKSKKQKYTKSKFKKKSPKQSRKFNKQSDYRKRAKRKK